MVNASAFSFKTAPRLFRLILAVCATFMLTIAISTFIGTAPEASAQQTYRTASGGSLNWGFKQSFRSYITTGAARGNIGVSDGASDDGTNFVLPPRTNGTTVTSDTQGTVELQGQIQFRGHQSGSDWILDSTLSNFKMQFNGNQAEIIVDIYAREFKGMTYDDMGQFKGPATTTLATVSLNNPANFSANTIDLSGSTTLTAAGAAAFGGFYDANIALDNTGGQLTIGDTTTAPTSGGSASTSGTSGTTECADGALGVMTTGGERDGLLGTIQAVNDTFAMFNNLFVNTERMFCNVDTLQSRFNPQAGTTTSGTTGTTTGGTTSGTTANTTAGTTSGTTSGTTGGTTSTAGGSVAAAAAGVASPAAAAVGGASGNTVCSADGSVGVSQSTAQWGVKSSFQNYIRGSIAKGQWELNGVGFENQQFQFSGSNGAVNPSSKSGTIIYPGSIHFTGHGGVLDLKISDIEIKFSGTSGELIANVVSQDMESNSTDYGRTVVATLNFSSLDISDSQASGSASTILSASGSQAFAEFYQPGQELDPISFSASLSGAANCAAAQGSGASGESVAGAGSGGMAAVAAGASSPTAGDGTTSDSYGNSGDSKFQIKSAGADSEGGLGLDTPTTLMLIVAAFVVAGGSMTRFTAGNPTG